MLSRLEEIARAILICEHPEYSNIGKLYTGKQPIEYIPQAQAAIEAMGVLILPADAKPEAGDIVIYKRGGFYYEVFGSDEAGYQIRNSCKELTVGALDLEIIKRGDMLVQQEKE